MILGLSSLVKGQGVYTITNNSAYYVDIVVRVATDANQCVFYMGLPTTTYGPFSLSPSSCLFPTNSSISIGSNDWVYQVEIYEESNCLTACSGSTGSTSLVAVLQPCSQNPDNASWSNCVSGSTASADLTSFCTIN